MKTAKYLDAIKSKFELPSDYAIAKKLGISRQAISNYRQGTKHFDEPIARRVAELLGIHPGIVLLEMQRERAQTDESRDLWDEIAKGFHALSLRANLGLRHHTSAW